MTTDQQPQIIAIGDHRLTEASEDMALSRYILDQAQPRTGEQPRICYLNQAGGEDCSFTLRFYQHYLSLGGQPTHLSLFKPHTAAIEDFLLAQDVIYVGGGNTKSLLALWREWGVDRILRQAWEAGLLLTGPSAGAICWFEEGSTDSIPGPYTRLACLGFLSGSCCPHYDGEPERRPSYQGMIQRREMQPGYAIDEYAALHFVGTELLRAVAGKANAAAYRVDPDGRGGVIERRLDVVRLLEEKT